VAGIIKYKGFWLSHAPIHPEELRGKPNIHGHVHTNTLNDSRYFNASLENIGYKPVSIEEVRRATVPDDISS
jgi:calcineurin-like phosphoesterase family protein